MRLQIVDSAEVTAVVRCGLRELWDAAYGDRFSNDDADHAFGTAVMSQLQQQIRDR